MPRYKSTKGESGASKRYSEGKGPHGYKWRKRGPQSPVTTTKHESTCGLFGGGKECTCGGLTG